MRRILASTSLIAILLVATTPAGAQQRPGAPPSPPPAQGGGMGGMMGGMQGGGTMGGMSGMSGGMCPMMGMAMMGGMMMDPGDAKARGRLLQMRGEMMKAMADVMIKYGQEQQK